MLKKGNYVLWVYNSYFKLANPNIYHYIVTLVSQSDKIKFHKIGPDSESKVVNKLMSAAATSEMSTAKTFMYTTYQRISNFK